MRVISRIDCCGRSARSPAPAAHGLDVPGRGEAEPVAEAGRRLRAERSRPQPREPAAQRGRVAGRRRPRRGRVLLASARVKWHRPPEYYSASHWRGRTSLDGGAALINQGVHTVDLLLWLLGPVPPGDGAHWSRPRLHAIEGEDAALALLDFASGAVRHPRGHDRGVARLPTSRRDLGDRRDGGRRGRQRRRRRPAPPGTPSWFRREPRVRRAPRRRPWPMRRHTGG